MKMTITSMAEGKEWETVSSYSFSTFERYAQRIGVDFVPLKGRKFPGEFFHWEKLSCANLLDHYERVMWINADAIIRSTTPSPFEVVPYRNFGAFDEGPFVGFDRDVQGAASFYGVKILPFEDRFPKYFNAGMSVFSRPHREIFKVPSVFYKGSSFPEQAYVNMRVHELGIPFQNMDRSFNAFSSWHPGEGALEAFHIIHYAGFERQPGWEDRMVEKMKRDYK